MENLLRLKISAPGKVILHGEHSVVYGKPALVAVISARNNLTLFENSSNEISFCFGSFDKICKIPLEDINTSLKKLFKEKQTTKENYDISSLRAAEKFVENASSSHLLEFSEEQHKKTIVAVLYLLLGIFLENDYHTVKNGFYIDLTSELDLGAGLGSSASFAVCFAAAFLTLTRFKEFQANKHLSPEWKSIISRWSFNSEKIMHGKPSGVDNTICTYGGLIEFKKGHSFTQIKLQTPLHILLVNSKVPRSTSKMVQKVYETHKIFPAIIDNIFNAMEETVKEATQIYKNFSADDQTAFDKIKQLFEINHDLLKAIGVSHERLNKISAIASHHGFSSKLTGAGGGGYMIILLPKNYKSSKDFDELCNEMLNDGFDWKEAVVGGEGVTVEIL